MIITQRKEISEADYNQYIKASKDDVEEFVGWAAHFSAYPPAGYGCMHPRVEKGEDKYTYYAVWERYDNCD